MKLLEYLNLYNGGITIDTSDSEIDGCIVIVYDKDDAEDGDFPYLCLAERELFSKVDVAQLNANGTYPVVAKYSDFIRRNIGKFREYVEQNWDSKYHYVLENDLQLCVEFIDYIDCLLAGNYSEDVNKSLYELFASCK